MLFERLPENVEFRIQRKEGTHFCLHNIALDPLSNEAALFLRQDNKEIIIAELSRNAGGARSMNFSLDFDNCNGEIVLLAKGGSVHIIGGYKKYNTADANAQVNNLAFESPRQNPQRFEESSKSKEKKQTAKESPLSAPKEPEQPSAQSTPLRRSTRARVPAKPVETQSAKAAKKQKQELNYLGKIFNCDIDSDDDDSFEDKNDEEKDQESQSDDEEEEDIEEKGQSGRKIKIRRSKLEQTEIAEETIIPETTKKTEEQSKSSNFSVPTRNPYT